MRGGPGGERAAESEGRKGFLTGANEANASHQAYGLPFPEPSPDGNFSHSPDSFSMFNHACSQNVLPSVPQAAQTLANSPFSPRGWTTGQHAPAAPSSPLWSGELHGWALLRLSIMTVPTATGHTVQSGECQQQVAPLVQGCRPSKATSSPAFFKALLYSLSITQCVRAAQDLRGFGFEGTFSSSR